MEKGLIWVRATDAPVRVALKPVAGTTALRQSADLGRLALL